MHFFQLVAAWMFPCAVCATMAPTVATAAATDGAATVDHDSPSSPAFSLGGVKEASDLGSSPSSRSSTSSSLLGARSSSSNNPRSPVSEGGGTAAPKGYAVRRCLRRFARKLPRAAAESAAEERPGGRRGRKKSRSTEPDRRGAAAVDGTASEREEAVGSAIAYCKETSRHRQRCTRQFAPSLSLDAWLLDRPEEENEIRTETAAAHCEGEGSMQVQGTASAAVPHHGYAACDECGGGPSAEEDADPASRRGPAGEQGRGDVFDGLDGDVLRITSYFAAKYVQCTIEE